MMKKVPQRMCLGCQQMKCKKELIRIVKNSENDISVDITGKKAGRGAYICSSIECLEKVIKQKKLERTFQQKIDSNVYETLKEELTKKLEK